MPFAHGNKISQKPIEGGIEITDAQFGQARDAMIAGQESVVVEGSLLLRDKAPSDGHTWENGEWIAPEPVPEPRTPTIAKNAIWERATDTEAVIMRALLDAQTVRVQEIYAGATHITTDHELYALLEAALVQEFGATRAGELLAPIG